MAEPRYVMSRTDIEAPMRDRPSTEKLAPRLPKLLSESDEPS
jgi:hypothetical protein